MAINADKNLSINDFTVDSKGYLVLKSSDSIKTDAAIVNDPSSPVGLFNIGCTQGGGVDSAPQLPVAAINDPSSPVALSNFGCTQG